VVDDTTGLGWDGATVRGARSARSAGPDVQEAARSSAAKAADGTRPRRIGRGKAQVFGSVSDVDPYARS
jgi:hypothetical protein